MFRHWPIRLNTRRLWCGLSYSRLDLREIELSGRKFTWANSLPVPTFEKLDRVLASVDWEQKFPLVTVQALTRGISDHTPLLVDSGAPTHLGNKNIFSFELAWFEREGLLELLAREWAKDSWKVTH